MKNAIETKELFEVEALEQRLEFKGWGPDEGSVKAGSSTEKGQYVEGTLTWKF